MGKMKEIFMKIYYPENSVNIDYEREYLVDDLLSQEANYLAYEKLKSQSEFNIQNAKIEVIDESDNSKVVQNAQNSEIQEVGF